MEMIRCPQCGKYLTVDDKDYYICESCSTQFHLEGGKDDLKAVQDYY